VAYASPCEAVGVGVVRDADPDRPVESSRRACDTAQISGSPTLDQPDDSHRPAVRIELLGPLRVLVDGIEVGVKGPRRRAALTLLALNSGRVVSVDTAVDALWSDEPPASGRHAVVSLLSRVRGHLGDGASCLERTAGGYRLRRDQVEIDLDVVRDRVRRARELAPEDPQRATLLRSALDQWRGDALEEFGEFEALAAHVVGLRELRLTVEDDWLMARLSTGDGEDLVEQTLRAAEEAPLREQRWLAHIRALALRGRTAEALRAGAAFRKLLADETGLDPSPALTDLERAVANGELAPTAAFEEDEPRSPGGAGPGLVWRTNRPTYVTALHGRAAELAQVVDLIQRERLVTIVGPGGVGKTRLLAEVLARLEEASDAAIVYVALASLDDEVQPVTADHVAAAVAASIGVRPSRGQTELGASREWLERRRSIVVLDNCEHVLDAARDVIAALLEHRADVRVMTTTRVPSGLPGECVVRLGPLPACREAGDDRLRDQPAVRLFCERAMRVTGRDHAPEHLPTIAEIADRLDGVPLAIELAAARLSTLTLDDLHRRIDHALDLLGDGRPTSDARHRSLRATFDWSYRLLDVDQRRMLAHLAAFADGADLDAVSMIATAVGIADHGIPQLAGLVDASIVLADMGTDTRYWMPEALRSFARHRHRDHGGGPSPGQTFTRWARATALDIDAASRGNDEPRADRRLRSEIGNLRAAHRAAMERGDVDTATAITISLDRAASFRDLPAVWSLARELADDPAVVGHDRESAVLGAAAEAAWLNGDLESAEQLATRGLHLDAACGRCHYALATVELFRGRFLRARELFTDASAQDTTALANAALAAVYGGDVTEAAQLIEHGSSWAETHGAPTDRAVYSYATGELRNPHPSAAQSYERAIELARRSGASFVEGVASVGLASVHVEMGAHRQALVTYRRLIRYWARTGNWTQQWITLGNVADLLRRLGDDEIAATLSDAVAAADRSPAPAHGSPPLSGMSPALSRSHVAELALGAIASHLASHLAV
jgi:predicted ATPase/DNA-binding SARP family transcriptional activator